MAKSTQAHGLVGRAFEFFQDQVVHFGVVRADLDNGFYLVAFTEEGHLRVVHIEELAKPTWLFYDNVKLQQKAAMEARLAIQKDIDAGNYQPYFDAPKRYDAPAKDLASPRATAKETQPGPKTKPESLAKWQQMIDDPAGHQRLRDMFEHGRAIGGGENWYQLGQLHAEFPI